MQKSSTKERMIYGTLLGLFCAVCIIPIISIVSISLSSEKTLIVEGYSLLPRGFSLDAYSYVLKDLKRIMRAYGVSIFVTVTGTALGLLLNSMFAYVLSRPHYRFRSKLTVYLTIPMVLNGGLVPTYMLITQYLHLKNNLLVLILPLAVVPWYIIMLRTFFTQIPYELSEAATIDGASEFRIYWQIVLPLAKPALATVGIFLALAYWNDWYYPMLYIENSNLVNLQYMLYRMMREVQELTRNVAASGMTAGVANLPTESMRMAMCVMAAGPMLVVFPFFQKYFVKGLTIGGVKG